MSYTGQRRHDLPAKSMDSMNCGTSSNFGVGRGVPSSLQLTRLFLEGDAGQSQPSRLRQVTGDPAGSE